MALKNALGLKNGTVSVGNGLVNDTSILPPDKDSINGVITSLVTNSAIGAACLLGFLLMRSYLKQYQLRMHVPAITLRPPPLPSRGLGSIFGWIKPVITISDAFILRSAGLDALVLQKAHTLGVQMLLPMAAISCCLLLPLQLHEAYIRGDSSYGRVTMANIWPGSAIMWGHFCAAFLFLGWTFTLLEYHTRQYASVRQHYLRGGDDPNYWRDLNAAEADGAHVHRNAKLLEVLGEARFEGVLEEEERVLEATGKGRPLRWYESALRSITSWTGDEGVEAAADHRGRPRSRGETSEHPHQSRSRSAGAGASGGGGNGGGAVAVEAPPTRGASPATHLDLAHDVLQGDFVRDADEAAARRRRESSAASGGNGGDGNGGDVILRVPDSAGGALPPPAVGSPTGATLGDGDGHGRLTTFDDGGGGGGASRTQQQQQQLLPPQAEFDSSRSASRKVATLVSKDVEAAGGGVSLGGGGSSVGVKGSEGGRLDKQPSTGLEEEVVDSLVAHRWWAHVEHVAAKGGRMRRLTQEEAADASVAAVTLARPSVRYAKTINTYDRAGRRVAVNAQQYAVLVTNVNQPCYPELLHGKRRIPGAGKCGNLHKDALPPAVKYELEGPLVGHAQQQQQQAAAAGGKGKGKGGPLGKGVERGAAGASSALVARDVEAGDNEPPRRKRAAGELWAAVRAARESGALRAVATAQGYSLVANIFGSLFPDDFDRVVPVFNFRRVDLLMRRWDVRQRQLERARFNLAQTGKRPTRKTKCMGGEEVDAIAWLEREIATLEPVILMERAAALQYGQTPSWFVLFRSQKAAAIAASCNILPMNQDLFQIHPAPGPEEVNWEALWFNHTQRTWRGWLTAPFAIVVVLLPVSLLTSAITQLNSTFCDAVKWEFYCASDAAIAKVLRGLLTGFLPSLLIILWQGLCMPRLVYLIAQSEGRHYSLSAVDRRMGEIYFYWDVFNMFAQGVLGSAAVSTAAGAAVFTETSNFINKPEEVPTLLGQALPASSKFFFVYVIMRTLMTVPLRFLITQPGVWQCWLRLLDLFSKPVPPFTAFMRMAIRSPRYGIEYGNLLLIMLICCAFSIISPLILLFGAAFFSGMWLFWRYQLIYNYQRKYEAGGLMWQFYVNRILVCCAIFVAFTGCVMIVKRAFVQATLLWLGGFLFTATFTHRLNRRYMNAIAEMPLMVAQLAPRARVPPSAYVPPPLQANGLGWYPEFNKVWNFFGMPGYSW